MSLLHRIRMWAILKYFFVFFLGFSTNTLIDLYGFEEESVASTTCGQIPAEELREQDLHFQLREPFKPKTMYEVLTYDYFNTSGIFNNFDDKPKTGLLGHQKADLQDISQQAMALFNSAQHQKWKVEKLINGYRRFDPLRGEEYIMDLQVELEKDSKIHEMHRLQVVKPFGPAQLVEEQKLDSSNMVHFLLPTTTDSERFTRFIENLDRVCAQIDEHIYVLVILFVGKSPTEEEKAQFIQERSSALSRKYKKAHVKVIQTGKEFSRAFGLDLGIKNLPQDALVFFCDADVIFTAAFIDRCRRNAFLGRRVFYPIVFAQYDPEIVQRYTPADKAEDLMNINKYTGHWVHYGFGMACMHVIDYRIVGGFNLQIKGWGGEDVDLYKKHIKSQLQVFRAPDPGLIHQYHKKVCGPGLSADQLRMCQDSMAEGIGSRQQLGKLFAETYSNKNVPNVPNVMFNQE